MDILEYVILFYTSAPAIWKGFSPSPDRLAKATKWEHVENERVIKVKNGTYRKAVFDGIFLIDTKHPSITSKNTDLVCYVYCLWYGHKLNSRGIEIKYQQGCGEIIENYDGLVISNLSK